MIDVTIPTWGLTMDDAVLTSWFKNVGDRVTAGDVLAEIEADKATGDLEAPATGVLAEILVEGDSEVVPGQVVARIDES